VQLAHLLGEAQQIGIGRGVAAFQRRAMTLLDLPMLQHPVAQRLRRLVGVGQAR
jgi:hypothetical protein